MNGLNILLVDDEKGLLEQAKIFLERIDENLYVEPVSSAAEAIEKIERGDYDAIISDYQMPEVNGLELLKMLRDEGYQIPFIIFTGKGREEVAMEALNLGADRYIQKGGDPRSQYAVVVDSIKQEVSRYRNEQILKERTQQLEAIFQDPNVFIGFVDLEGNLIKANKSALRFIGYKGEEVEGKKFWNTPWWDHSEEFQERLKKAIHKSSKGGYDNFKAKHISKNGEEIFVDFFIRPVINKKGAVSSLIAEGIDITNINEKEKKLRFSLSRLKTLMENQEAGILFEDENRNILYVNQKFCDFFDIPDPSLMVGKNCAEMSKKASAMFLDPKSFVQGIEKLLEKNKSTSDELKLKNGITFLRDYTPVYSEDKSIGHLWEYRDITERKEKELKKKNRFQETIIENANVWIDVVDNKGNIVVWNRGAEKISGYDRDEVVGTDKIWEWLYPDKEYREWIRKSLNRMLEKEISETVDTKISCKDGKERIISWQSQPFRDDNGNIIGSLAIGRDVTEQKRTEKELEKSKNRYETLFEENPEAIIEVNEDFEILSVNRYFEELFGYKEEEIVGGYIEDIIVPKHKLTEAKELENTAKEGGYTDYETARKNKDGKEIPVAITSRSVKYNEKDHYLVVYRDISKRKKAEGRRKETENKLKKLHEVATKLEGIESEDKICQIAVEAAENILEFSVCSINLIDENGILVVKAASEDASPEDYIETIPEESGIAGKTLLKYKSYLIHDVHNHEDAKPQKESYKSAISVPIKNKGVFQAISTEVEYFGEQDLELAELLISHVSEALDRVEIRKRENFLHSLLRHDVGNKAQIVAGYLELMNDYDLTEEVEEYVNKAKKAVAEGVEVIEKVKKLRQIEEKKDIGTVNISSTLNMVLSEHDDQLKENRIDVNVTGDSLIVKGGSLLKELFSNIIENAIKHSNCDEIKISFFGEEERCTVVIEDDGKGIADDVKEKIFRKGFRAGENAGSGLGMYMVKEIAESYGGSIKVKDSDMSGAKFEISLKKVS